MSALGQKRTFALRNAMSALSPESGHLEGRMVTMALVKTELEPSHLQRNADDFAVVRSIAESGSDGPVLMLNMNRYSLDSGFPDRGVYQQYISGLGNFLEGAGAKLLWRFLRSDGYLGVICCYSSLSGRPTAVCAKQTAGETRNR